MISVITPVFNGEKYIRECIESVIEQDGVEVEHIMVDDGSTDKTASIISEYRNIIYINQDNKGATAARNKGLSVASGQFVKFLDADDMLCPGALVKQYKKARLLDEKEISYGYSEAFYETGRKSIHKRNEKTNIGNNVADLIWRNIVTSLSLYPIAALKFVGGFDERMHSRQEWNLNIKLSSYQYNFIFDDVFIFRQRYHSDIGRISNRKLIVEKELKNLNYAFESIAKTSDPLVLDAWASYLWGVGRQFLLCGDTPGARVFFGRAKTISPCGYKRFFTTKYKIVSAVLGPVYSDLFFAAAKRIKNHIS